MTEKTKTPAEEIAAAIHENRSGEDLDAALLVGFVLVAEFMDADGERWLTKMCADGSGDCSRTTIWQERGYLSEALNNWPDPCVDDEED